MERKKEEERERERKRERERRPEQIVQKQFAVMLKAAGAVSRLRTALSSTVRQLCYVSNRERAIKESNAFAGGGDAAPMGQGMLVDRVVPVVNRSLVEVGKLTLPGLIYDQPLRKDIVHRVVVWQRANWRQGSVKVKTRAEVRGGGRKPWPQKGTGRARAGSIRSPLFRGGGKAHGPRPKDWSQSLNSKIRRLGLRVSVFFLFSFASFPYRFHYSFLL